MEQKVKEEGRELTCCVNTFGCQMNARDPEKSFISHLHSKGKC